MSCNERLEETFKPKKGEYFFPVIGVLNYCKRTKKARPDLDFSVDPVVKLYEKGIVKLVVAQGLGIGLIGFGMSKIL